MSEVYLQPTVGGIGIGVEEIKLADSGGTAQFGGQVYLLCGRVVVEGLRGEVVALSVGARHGVAHGDVAHHVRAEGLESEGIVVAYAVVTYTAQTHGVGCESR